MALTSVCAIGAVERKCEIYVESDAPEIELTLCRTDFDQEQDVLISKGCLSEKCLAFQAFLKAPHTPITVHVDAPDLDMGYEMCELLNGKPMYAKTKFTARNRPILCKFKDNSYIGLVYINPDFM